MENDRPTQAPTNAQPKTYREDSERAESIPHLIRGLAADLSNLFSKEISLAKAEFRQAGNQAKAGITGIAVGAGIVFSGLLITLMSAVYALSNVVDPWLAALIVGLAALLVGFILIKSAQRKINPEAFVPERTVDSVRKDTNSVRRAVK